MTGLHAATLIAGFITVIAAAGVFLWLPAKARPDVDDDAPPPVKSRSADGAGEVRPAELVALVEASESAEPAGVLRADGIVGGPHLAEGRS